jgi:cytochrome aa3-600 menaquinol oxidase subunit 2
LYILNGTRSFNTLVVKAGELYRLELTSRDIIRSFYIPELGIKYDAVPGFVYVRRLKVDTLGVYNIYCAEYCGSGRYLMLGKVVEP